MVQVATKPDDTTFQYRPEKLEAAILFFLRRANNGHMGKTKLMKLLYYADFDHMERYGHPITGAHYRKLDQGPVPVEAFDLLTQMELEGKIRSEKRDLGPYTQFRYEAMEKPKKSLFEHSEVETLERVGERWENEPLNRIVAATHAEAPWLSVRMGEMIPYRLAYYRRSLGSDW